MAQWINFDLQEINIERNRNGKMSISQIVAERIIRDYLLSLKPVPAPTEEEMNISWPNSTTGTS